MHSLQMKLLAGLVAVAALAVAVVAVVATQATDTAFAQYVRQGQTARLLQVQADLADFYSHNRSWTGVQSVLDNVASPMGQMGAGMGRGLGRGAGSGTGATMMDGQAILADGQGVVVASVGPTSSSPRLTSREMTAAAPIIVDGHTVGLLLAQGAGLSSFSALEQGFISNVNRGLLLAAILAGGLAIGLSLVISRRITAPLASMTQAAQAIARGDRDQRVRVDSKDEVGRLAEAFNVMAASVARSEQLRRDLVADVAHELRTPIAVLRADLEALQDGVYQPTPDRIAGLREEIDLLTRLVSDLQELSLAEAGMLALEQQPTDLVQLCRQVVAAMAPQASARGIDLTVDKTVASAISVIDADRMGQVLRNLVGNALRYTAAGGSITLHCRTDGKMATLAVSDTGRGISAQDLPHIFDRFYRGEKSRARSTGGAGLGLAIARQLVEAHGGRIWAESAQGKGATFYISLPAEMTKSLVV